VLAGTKLSGDAVKVCDRLSCVRVRVDAVRAQRILVASAVQRGSTRRLALDLSRNLIAPVDVEAIVTAVSPLRLALSSLRLDQCRL
jgi:hypothetical protein